MSVSVYVSVSKSESVSVYVCQHIHVYIYVHTHTNENNTLGVDVSDFSSILIHKPSLSPSLSLFYTHTVEWGVVPVYYANFLLCS